VTGSAFRPIGHRKRLLGTFRLDFLPETIVSGGFRLDSALPPHLEDKSFPISLPQEVKIFGLITAALKLAFLS
jgi:hypothetical protein